jgi:hypothetical protein
MSVFMPRVIQTPTPSYSPTPIQHDLVVVHMMEGGCAGSVAWLCSGNVQASAHLCMSDDGLTVYQLVPLSMKAWAQCAFNDRGVSLEIPGFTAQGIPEARWRSAADIVAWLCRAYSIPPIWAQNGQGCGVCQHHDLGAAGGGHVDCSGVGSPTWLTFMGYVKAAYDALSGPLPAFALHGLPNPHQVEFPPDAPFEPSHGGAARSEPNATALHQTVSGFPTGSVKDLQWRLNDAGAQPALDVDGEAGKKTRDAIAAFQGKHGLFVDGLIGPATWASLNAATGA